MMAQAESASVLRPSEIYVFVNGGGPGRYVIDVITEDGEILVGHRCETIDDARHDFGVTSDRRHALYAARYPHGFRVIWIDDVMDPRLVGAYEKARRKSGSR